MKKMLRKIFSRLKGLLYPFLFLAKFGFWPSPAWSDLSKYEILLEEIEKEEILNLKGDFVEIGTFLGGGTYKLCCFLEKKSSNKKIYSIDVFSPDFDTTICDRGTSMKALYKRILKGKNQLEIFKKITANCHNLRLIIGDSKKVKLPIKRISFAYIDGNHSPEYVENDFYLVWDKVVSKGIVSFDDYGYDLPEVTKKINEIIGKNYQKIDKIWTKGKKTIFIKKF